MINKIFIEKEFIGLAASNHIIESTPHNEVIEIDNYQDYFGKYKKQYLEKRNNLNLFIARKKGQLLKEAPNAYGLNDGPHYYYVHAYNCIYECSYCYLQGYFDSPDLVLFINHDEILLEIESKILEHQKISNDYIWFHAGEFSDSLALSHITNELPLYFNLFKKYPNARLELRTKSVNIKQLLALSPSENIVTSFSLSPSLSAKEHDLKTPSLKARLSAIKKLYDHGHPIGIHLDPIIYKENIIEEYSVLIDELAKTMNLGDIEYLSVGVVRFTKDVYYQARLNYPDASYFHSELSKGQDGKIKYPRPLRLWILNTIRDLCIKKGMRDSQIYLCMED